MNGDNQIMSSSRLFDVGDRSVLITGAAGGIGAAIAHEFAACGAKLILVDRTAEAAEALAIKIGVSADLVIALGVDVKDSQQCHDAVKQAADTFGGLDVLINGAGVNTRMRPEAYTEELWNDIIAVNLNGTFNMCQAAHSVMASSGGKIVNFGSILSLVSTP